jgi:hypothetical protein
LSREEVYKEYHKEVINEKCGKRPFGRRCLRGEGDIKMVLKEM